MTGASPIGRSLDASYVLEASAGTGKTTQLVQRIVDVIAAGADVERIAAVTFTVAAAGEMKLRIGEKLEQSGHAHAVRRLERAFVGTIHAFCANMLRQRPVEAGVDPGFEELAEPERVFARVFQPWLQERLTSSSVVLHRAFARLAWRDERRGSKPPVQALQDCAWELVQWRDYATSWTRREFDRDGELDVLLARTEDVIALRERCDRKDYDLLYKGLQPLADFMERVRRARDLGERDYDTWEGELLAMPGAHRFLRPGSGKWSQTTTREQVKSAWDELCLAISDFKKRADASLAVELQEELWPLVDRYETAKRRAGQLDFLDLLVKARGLLNQPSLCEYFQQRFEYLFIDEFQDTDPLQIEILQRLAGHRAGKLFVVGDPKQSIYRFRRADVGSFNSTCEHFIAGGAISDRLQISHRSVRPIQEFVNAAFAPQMANYLSLEGGREPTPTQPAVLALPIPEPFGKMNIAKAAINKCTPVTVAAFIRWLVDSKWTVLDRDTKEQRPVQAKDVCILFRRFTNDGQDLTQDYVRCLEAQGLPHVLVGSKSFHHREEVAAIRTALRAIEWPDDELSVYATVRNFYGLLDGTLFQFKHKYGALRPFLSLPDEIDTDFLPIRDALAHLHELHKERNTRPIADTIHSLLENVRALTAFSLRKGGRRVVANVQRLLETARSFELRHATSFRSFVLYLEEQSERGEASDAPILEQDSDGVKIMTVHKAKGLEFPVVILADLSAHLTGQGDRYVDPEKQLCAQRLVGCAPWDLLENLETEAALDRAEGIRVAYVAATRARDLLVVCAIGDTGFVKEHPLFKESWLAPLYEALYPHDDRWRTPEKRVQGRTTVLQAPAECADDRFLMPGLHVGRSGGCPVWWFDPARLDAKDSAESGLDDKSILVGDPAPGYERYQEWKIARQHTIDRAAAPSFQIRIASEETGGEQAPVIRAGDRPAVKGSRRFGKMVHGILQYGLAASHSQMREHGCTEEERLAAVARAQAALQHPLLIQSQQAERTLREYPVLMRLDDGTLIEGRADLAFFDGTTWTVVDYKTGDADARDRAQIQMYAQAFAQATNQPVRAVILLV